MIMKLFTCANHKLKKILKLYFSVLFFFSAQFLLNSQAINSYWTLVFAGKNTTSPVFWNGNIYAAGADRALNCITSEGKFLWRRNTKELPSRFISVSRTGVVYLISNKGNLEVFSSQGMPAWNYKLKQKAIFPVYTARDGRSFIIQSNNIICLTSTGALKWEKKLASAPIAPPVETGSKDIILILKSGDFVRVSIFGEIVEQHHLKKTVSAIGEAPAGYILACTDGSISYYKTKGGSQSLWQFKENSICTKIVYSRGKVLYLFKNGKIIYKNLEKNDTIWEVETTASFSSKAKCRIASNEFNITAKGFGCVVTDKGRLKWQRHIPETSFTPIITENGLLIGITKEVLNAYRAETKLTRRGRGKKKKEKEEEFYSIIDNKKASGSKQEMPFFIEYASVAEFLKVIEKDIKNGSVGTKEPRYAFQLKTILENKRKASYIQQDFMPLDRSRSAELLGLLGSYEYRDILINQIQYEQDTSVLAGCINGLMHLAYDPDGKTIDALNLARNKARYNDTDIMTAVIDCLAVLIKYGNKKTAKRAISTLFLISTGPYSNIIQNYARQKIKNIV